MKIPNAISLPIWETELEPLAEGAPREITTSTLSIGAAAMGLVFWIDGLVAIPSFAPAVTRYRTDEYLYDATLPHR